MSTTIIATQAIVQATPLSRVHAKGMSVEHLRYTLNIVDSNGRFALKIEPDGYCTEFLPKGFIQSNKTTRSTITLMNIKREAGIMYGRATDIDIVTDDYHIAGKISVASRFIPELQTNSHYVITTAHGEFLVHVEKPEGFLNNLIATMNETVAVIRPETVAVIQPEFELERKRPAAPLVKSLDDSLKEMEALDTAAMSEEEFIQTLWAKRMEGYSDEDY